ncbi:MAG: hypothetical protein GXP51_08485 [Deltaproteobacteria bacterium]|nr:hypothetical protein [Deltaproteobacteria bacterium]
MILQVLQTRPELEFRIINDPLGGRLSQLLPLLTRPYDWIRLLDILRQQPRQQGVPQTTTQVYRQLQQLLQPNGPLPVAIESALASLPAQLQQLSLSVANEQSRVDLPPQVVTEGQGSIFSRADNSVPLDLSQLVRGLRNQQSQLSAVAGRPLPPAWHAETGKLLAPLLQNLPQVPVPLPGVNDLIAVLGEMRQQPNLPAQLTGELERLLLQLKVSGGQELPPVGKYADREPAVPPTAAPVVTTTTPSAVSTRQAMQTLPSSQPPQELPVPPAGIASSPAAGYRSVATTGVVVQTLSSPPPPPPAEISAGLERLLTQIQPEQNSSGQLSAALLGRLEGLLDKLQQLSLTVPSGQTSLPGLELITRQLSQLIQPGAQQPKGEPLGFLSQLFGFHLEAELLNGKKKEALASLKLSLLTLKKELGDKVEEPLRRLEMFQLSKARLAEAQVQFLPLPFSELEEGYLLMEKRRQQDDGTAADLPLQLSLSLRLSALGNMRVDMLYEKQGLHLRVACEDKEKKAYLQDHLTELKESIETVPLHGVSFSADARQPARELSARLLPDTLSMLDARI